MRGLPYGRRAYSDEKRDFLLDSAGFCVKLVWAGVASLRFTAESCQAIFFPVNKLESSCQI